MSGFRLSPQQERLWALADDDRVPYHGWCALSLRGPLDRAALRDACRALVGRYEVLRTTFRTVAGLRLPLQAIGGPELAESEEDLSGRPDEEREARLAELLAPGGRRRFDFAQGPLVGFHLVSLEPGRHLLLLRAPSLLADLPSLRLLAEELPLLYAAAADGVDAPLDEPVQYADLAQWQNDLLESEEMEGGRAFWRRQAVAEGLVARLPFAAPDGATGSFAPCTLSVEVDEALRADLAERALSRDGEISDLLLAAWQLLLARLSGHPSMVVGVSFEGRSFEGLERAVGPLVRFLPLAVEVDETQPFSRFWKSTAERRAELREWQEYFSWSALEAAAPCANFAFEALPGPEPRQAAGLAVEAVRLYSCAEPFELKLAVVARDSGPEIELHFDPRIYRAEDAERLAGQLAAVLAAVAADPDVIAGRVPLVTPEERRLLVGDLAAAPKSAEPPAGVLAAELGAGEPVHRLFARRAQERPSSPAVIWEDRVLRYGELASLVSGLARRLRAEGVGPESVVGLALERSADTIVALLAVLSAGGAYLPLDPSLPVERLRFMLAAAGAQLVLGREGVLDLPEVRLLPLHRLLEESEGPAPSTFGDEASGMNLAYVLFTSGSTGWPKGVAVEHRQLSSYLAGVLPRLGLSPGASYALVSTLAADLGHTVLFPALISGGCLHVLSQERLADADAFAEFMEHHAIDCLKIVPSHLEALLAASRPERSLPRRRLVLGGEASRWEWIERLQALAPACRILNHYGPTESTVGVLTYEIEPAAARPSAAALVPLGRPLAGARVYVLDREGEPAPLWSAGEIYAAGRTVARGYAGRPDLTAERFLPDPWSPEPGARMYRTGDLARRLPTGDVEFLGRLDDQVKIHGFRVELGEVQAALAALPAVRECAVLVRDEGGQRRLVAYLAAAGATPSASELRAALAQRLPEFMLPASFVDLPALPRTANGKVDRVRLSQIAPRSPEATAVFASPETAAERALAAVWAEVLGLARIGRDDNFFHLGGDSIRSIEVRARARRLGIEISIAELFRHQTLRALASHLGESRPSEAALAEYQPFSLLSPADRERLPGGLADAFPLCLMQQGMLFHSLASTGAATYHDVGSYRFRMPYDPEALGRAARTLVARHGMLRTSFHLTGFSEPLQLVHREAELPLTSADWTATVGEDRSAWQAWLTGETRAPFDWQRPPLFRLFLHRVTTELSQLTVSFHHAILDGWSRHSIVTELLRLYLRETGRELPPPPPVPTLAFGEFVALERAAIASDEHRGFWRERLAGSERLKLPVRSVPPPNTVGYAARVHIETLSRELSEDLHALARRCGVPIKSVLLAASLRELAVLAGRTDLTSGLVVNGRPEERGGDRASGLFLNTVPVRVRLSGGSWTELVQSAFAAEAEVLPYRRFPLAELQRTVGGGEPLFETAFNFMHYHIYRGILEVEGVELLDYLGFEETNLACVFNFHQDPMSSILQLGIEYHSSLLWSDQVARMAGEIRAILAAMAASPESRYDLFSGLSPEERQQLAYEWNDTRRDRLEGGLIHALFEAQAASTPGAPALVGEVETLTYAELDARANRLAWALRDLGVGPEVPVALLLERSVGMVVAILGVLKAGGAYVPLDPGQPRARLDFLLGDVHPPVLLAERNTVDRAQGAVERVLLLSELEMRSDPRMAFSPPPIVGSDNAAYIIYTSGSTGRPKGVVCHHRGVCNRLAWGQAAFPLTADDRVLQKTPYGFDISIWEIFWPLAVGGRLVLARPGGHRDPGYLAERVAGEAVTVLHFVPSLLQLFLEEAGIAAAKASLRLVICSGEALPRALAERFAARVPGAELVDLYGPTEAAIEVSWHLCRRGEEGPVPIGRPIDNLALRVLDPWLLPAPAGVAGELYIGGTGVARGYLGRPDLTAERFLPDPWGRGTRIYRTGDLARYRPDGEVEFLGRIDDQVKLRGLRIEPGEVEVLLARLPGVRECAVVAREVAGETALVAYWVADGDPGPEATAALRTGLRGELPEAMIPAHFVRLAAMPLTTNGKLDRRALPAPAAPPPPEAPSLPPESELERRIAALWQEVLRRDSIGVLDSFFDLGGHSLSLLRVHARLREELGREIPIVDLFRFPTIRSLAAHLGTPRPRTSASLGRERAALRGRLASGAREPVAIVGMSCRFPGAEDVEQFWHNLVQGVESIVRLGPEELAVAGVPKELLSDPRYVPARGRIAGIDLFDAAFFGYSPMDASLIDPQQRIFLECAWAALEDAGYDSARYPGAIGLYAGTGMNSYVFGLYSRRSAVGGVGGMGGYQGMLANDKDFLATRASYKLDLKGPSLTVQTACSTSLVAVHLACLSLHAGECDMALAGGVRIAVPTAGYLYEEGGIHSPDGHCRAFDARAAGMVGGDGAGVVVLKRLSTALADGDTVHALILGSAVDNDGAQRVGFTAPGVDGQARVIAESLAVAGVEAGSIRYVEAHGTATALGDPIEVAALVQAFRESTEERGFCALGSVKTNIGHLDAAAGVAGLIKTALALERKALPPSLHFERPNPAIDFAASPFYVNARLADWPAAPGPRRAGVSSMGIGGTNAHVVLEEAPEPVPSGPSRGLQVLPLSARTPDALVAAAAALADHLERHPEFPLADVAYTLQVGRRAFQHRLAVVCASREEAIAALRGEDSEHLLQGDGDPYEGLPVALLFPGQGAQYAGMAEDLYREEAAFRAEVDHAAELLAPHCGGRDLRHLLFPDPAAREAAGAELRRTELAQPALFVVEYALARLLESWGVRPDCFLGHSVGELTAAALAGVFTLPDALAVVAARGRLIGALPGGAMLSVPLSEEAAARRLAGSELTIAAVNGPALSTVSGPEAAVEALALALAAEGIESRRLHTSHAFHSAAVEAAVAPFVAVVEAVERRPPRIPFLSNVTGTWITAEEATDPLYWGRQLRQTVRFAEGLATLFAGRPRALVEAGPGRGLATLVRQHPDRGRRAALSTLPPPRHGKPSPEALFAAVAGLWLRGVTIDWQAFTAGERRRRLPLPTYPFERRRFWIDAAPAVEGAHASSDATADLNRRLEIADWFHVPAWRLSPLRPELPAAALAGPWLLLLDETGVGRELAGRLEALGQEVFRAIPGEERARLEPTTFSLDPGRPEHYREILQELAREGKMPRRIVHLWSLTAPQRGEPCAAAFERGCESLVWLAQAVDGVSSREAVRLDIVASGVLAITAAELVEPERAALLGPCRVIPQEIADLSCRVVDVPPASGPRQRARLAAQLLAELAADSGTLSVAYRGAERWTEGFDPLHLERPAAGPPPFAGRVYLVTGGLSASSYGLAELLARGGARLVVAEAPGFPPEERWEEWTGGEGTARRIARARRLRESGAELWVQGVDLTSPGQVRALLADIDLRFGGLHGLVHVARLAEGVAFLPLHELSPERLRAILATAVQEIRSLDEALSGRDLDHGLSLASNAAILGGLGATAMAVVGCIANAWVGGKRPGETPWAAVDWDYMDVDAEELTDHPAARSPVYEMTAAEGMEVLLRLLHHPGSRLAVSPVDLRARLRAWVERGPAVLPAEAAAPRHPRPAGQRDYVAPQDETERAVAAIWQELLGIDRVGIRDDFFELGGHSLLATQLASRLRAAFQVVIPLSSLFSAHTVEEQARAVVERQLDEADPQAVARLLKEIRGLSSQEVQTLMQAENSSN